ncbi:MAG TPA: SUMF1/EgtB/PvdO family nonheme iron enzyme [Leptolyngbyaceae cyanobacterium]
MPRCPVCQSKYVHNKDSYCPCCNWNLPPYPFPIAWIPEIIQKEDIRLAWAQKIWSLLQSAQDKLNQAQIQLEQANQSASQMSLQLEQSYQERSALSETLQKQEAKLKLLQEQLQQSSKEIAQLQTELDGIKQQRPQNQQTIEPNLPIQTVSISDNLQEFSFEVVTLNNMGQPINCSINKAQYFPEPLGNSLFLDMVYIPSGTFLMGSPENELGRESNEGPQHPVTLPSFYISRFPITQTQWKKVAGLPQINRYLNPELSNFQHPDLPVEQVCWYDAVEFCERLSQLTNHRYQLPSEAQWEFACRAGTTTPFHYGETITSHLANYDGSYIYDSETEGLYRQKTTPVGSFQLANAFGLSDLHGNVWEWCADSWHENYQNAPADGSVWQLDEANNCRVLRGGAWYCLPTLCRSAQRHWDKADHAGSGTGFRVVCLAI